MPFQESCNPVQPHVIPRHLTSTEVNRGHSQPCSFPQLVALLAKMIGSQLLGVAVRQRGTAYLTSRSRYQMSFKTIRNLKDVIAAIIVKMSYNSI